MVCHEKVLEAAKTIVGLKGTNEFTPAEVMQYLKNQHTVYSESTIRTHVVSRCCINAPKHHIVRYDYFERIGRGLYKLR